MPDGSEVTEEQMIALFGEGLHPNAERITTHLTGAGTGNAGAHAAARLGRPFRLGANENEFTRRLRAAYAAYNTTLGRSTGAPLDPDLRAEIRTTVGRDMFTDNTPDPPPMTGNSPDSSPASPAPTPPRWPATTSPSPR